MEETIDNNNMSPAEKAEVKEMVRVLNQLSKKHKRANNVLSELHHDIALFRAILRHEKKTTTRPEEIYIENIKRRIQNNIKILSSVYNDKAPEVLTSSSINMKFELDSKTLVSILSTMAVNETSSISLGEFLELYVNKCK